MVGNKSVYWVAQFTGWLLYAFILLIYNSLSGQGVNLVIAETLLLITVVGIFVTHAYRWVILKWHWLNLPIQKAIWVLLLSSVILGIICHVFHFLLSELFIPNMESIINMDLKGHVELIINWMLLMFVWSILYFTTHYFANYKKAEITNLKMVASQNEIELINLKSQLNPHFMFNALNSIRALVDEDPAQAKNAITQLSAMLRGALQTGKRQLISLEEELSLVKSYLAIEKIRFEERLKVFFEIDPASINYNIPPLLLQTLVENGVKHGISSLTKGGELHVKTELDEEGRLMITVKNSGKFKAHQREQGTGIGLKNSERRLGLLYGKEAEITITNQNNEVLTAILIPKNLIYENINN